MPRPRKCRRVCSMPDNTEFAPVGVDFIPADAVVMTVDEYESIRLIDHQGFIQEECAEYMKIARTTVQQIYNDARKKLSVVLVEGKPLVISGGDFQLCDGKEAYAQSANMPRAILKSEKRTINDTGGTYHGAEILYL